MFRPLNDCVVVEPIKPPETNQGGVALTEEASRQYHGLRAVVVAVGPGPLTLSGVRSPIDLRPGDVVILRHAGPLVRQAGRVFCLVGERDVLAVVEGEVAVTPYSVRDHSLALVD